MAFLFKTADCQLPGAYAWRDNFHAQERERTMDADHADSTDRVADG